MPLLRRTHRPGRAHLSPRERVPALTPRATGAVPALDDADAATFAALREGDIEVVGQLTDASNGVFLVVVSGLRADGGPGYAVLKPVRYERPLWDFPDGTLAGREVAACLVDRVGGWGLIPATVFRATPAASLQRWVGALPPGVPDDPAEGVEVDDDDEAADAAELGVADFDEEVEDDLSEEDLTEEDLSDEHVPDLHDPEDAHVVTLLRRGTRAPGWLPVLPAQLADGSDVVVAHADNPRLASLAVLDAALNNTDRKGSHVLRDNSGGLWGIDHGVCLHEDDKLRTILWGWRGKPLPAEDVSRLERLAAALAEDGPGTAAAELSAYLTATEIDALRRRVDRLLATRVFPAPSGDWHSIPWPPI